MLFLKEQRSLFLRLMDRVLPAFPNYRVRDIKGMLRDCKNYESFRYKDEDLVATDRIPLLQMIMPSLRAKLRLVRKSERFETGTSILLKYALTKETQGYRRALGSVRMRNCHFSRRKIKECAQRQKEREQETICNFYDDYSDLIEFAPPSLEFLRAFCSQIIAYNREVKDKDRRFWPFFPKVCDRVAAATKIQSLWRTYKNR